MLIVKKILLLLVLLFTCFSIMFAQLEGRHWVERDAYDNYNAPNYEDVVIENYKVEGDTTIEGIFYKKVYVLRNYDKYYSRIIASDSVWKYYSSIREDNDHRIFSRDAFSPNKDVLLYDFSEWQIGDTLYRGVIGKYQIEFVITEVNLDSVQLLDGKFYKVIKGNYNIPLLIKGIGERFGFFWTSSKYARISAQYHGIIEYYIGGKLIYENHDYLGLTKKALLMDKWEENEFIYNSTSPNGIDTLKYTYWFEGDTIFNDLKYKKVHRKFNIKGVEYNSMYFYFIRESSEGKLYFTDGNYQSEFILYDFSKWELNDSVFSICLDGYKYSICASTIITNENLDSVLLMNGNYAQYVKKASDIYIINGIGFKSGFFSHISIYAGNYMGGEMIRCFNDGNIIWQNPKYTSLHNDESIEKLKCYESQGCLLFELNSKASIIDLYTIDGVFKKSYFVEGCEMFTTEKQKPGFYIYQIRDKNQKTILSGKVNIR